MSLERNANVPSDVNEFHVPRAIGLSFPGLGGPKFHALKQRLVCYLGTVLRERSRVPARARSHKLTRIHFTMLTLIRFIYFHSSAVRSTRV